MKQPLAYVHPDAKVADNVVIEPFVTIDQDVVIGEGTRIGSGELERSCQTGRMGFRTRHNGWEGPVIRRSYPVRTGVYDIVDT